MSQNRTILSFVHQNSPSVVKAPSTTAGYFSQLWQQHEAREVVAELQRNSPVSLLLSSRFPFNQCTDPQLTELKHSVRDGVRYAAKDYCGLHLLTFACYRTFLAEHGAGNGPADDEEEDSTRPAIEAPAPAKLPSILVKNTPDTDRLVLVFKEVLPLCLGLSEELMHDAAVAAALTFATNIYLQRFKSSSTQELCREFLRHKDSGELREALSELQYDLMDKHDELAFDRFEDLVFEGTTGEPTRQNTPSLDDPDYYRWFLAIFSLDPSDLLEFSLHDVIAEYASEKRRPYSNLNSDQLLMDAYGTSALKMNIVRFFYAGRSEYFARKRQPGLAPVNLDKVPEFAVLQSVAQQYLKTGEEAKTSRPKTKSLRFADPPIMT